jgi:hypothetical protein
MLCWTALLAVACGCRRSQPLSTARDLSSRDSEAAPAADLAAIPHGPLHCLLAEGATRIHVQFGYRGCFGGSDNLLDIDNRETSVVVGRAFLDRDHDLAIGPTPLGAQDRASLLGSLVRAAHREQNGDRSENSTKAFARIFYWCGGEKQGPVMFETHQLSPSDRRSMQERHAADAPAPRDASSRAGPPPYARAHGVIAAALEAFDRVPSRPQKRSDELRERERRAWQATFDDAGYRIRHDPDEYWEDP